MFTSQHAITTLHNETLQDLVNKFSFFVVRRYDLNFSRRECFDRTNAATLAILLDYD